LHTFLSQNKKDDVIKYYLDSWWQNNFIFQSASAYVHNIWQLTSSSTPPSEENFNDKKMTYLLALSHFNALYDDFYVSSEDSRCRTVTALWGDKFRKLMRNCMTRVKVFCSHSKTNQIPNYALDIYSGRKRALISGFQFECHWKLHIW
jgi:hypothetical protein